MKYGRENVMTESKEDVKWFSFDRITWVILILTLMYWFILIVKKNIMY